MTSYMAIDQQKKTLWLLAFASALLILMVAHQQQDLSGRTAVPVAVASDESPALPRSAPAAAVRRSRSAATPVPRTQVYFLKTHKCASTTVQRIIFAYGLRRNLSIALPRTGGNNFYPRPYSPELAKVTDTHPKFDIMATHARYHPSAKGYMPKDAAFVSIVRDPADQMESVYYYFYRRKCPGYARKSFDDYIAGLPQPTRQASGTDRGFAKYRLPCYIADMRFLQLHDLGMSVTTFPTRERVAEYIAELDRSFDLVLLVERIDEGLILLRDLLGWTTSDIVYLRSNSRQNGSSKAMSNATRQKALAWNWADKMLYDHFKAKFEDTVRRRADYMRRELEEFRRRQESFYDFCVESVTSSRLGGKQAMAVKLSSYELSDQGKGNESCRVAAMTELQLFDRVNELRPARGGQRGAVLRSQAPA